MFTIDCSQAFSAGLDPRLLQVLIYATLDWDHAHDPTADVQAGRPSDREAQLYGSKPIELHPTQP